MYEDSKTRGTSRQYSSASTITQIDIAKRISCIQNHLTSMNGRRSVKFIITPNRSHQQQIIRVLLILHFRRKDPKLARIQLGDVSQHVSPPFVSSNLYCQIFNNFDLAVIQLQIWEQLFQSINNRNKKKMNANFFLKGVTDTIFKPLMVVTQKISSVFEHKKRKLNQQQEINDSNGVKNLELLSLFRKTMDMQKQLQMKMSDFDLEDCSPLFQKYFYVICQPKNTYTTNIFHQYYFSLNNFFTQILDSNQVARKEGNKVKILTPTQEFYGKLVIAWLICQQARKKNQLLNIISILWLQNSSLKIGNQNHNPDQYFYQKMKIGWEQTKKQKQSTTLNEKNV